MMKKEKVIQTAMLERREGEAEKTALCLLFKLLQCHTFTHIFRVCHSNNLGLKSKHPQISVFTTSLTTVFQIMVFRRCYYYSYPGNQENIFARSSN